MIDPEHRGELFRKLKPMTLDALAEYHAFNAKDLPVTPRELAEAEFLRRQTEAQMRTAKATALAAFFTGLAALGAAVSAATAAAMLLDRR